MAIKNEPHVSRDIESHDLPYNYRLLDDAILSQEIQREGHIVNDKMAPKITFVGSNFTYSMGPYKVCRLEFPDPNTCVVHLPNGWKYTLLWGECKWTNDQQMLTVYDFEHYVFRDFRYYYYKENRLQRMNEEEQNKEYFAYYTNCKLISM